MSQGNQRKRFPIGLALVHAIAGMGRMPVVIAPHPGEFIDRKPERPKSDGQSIMAFQRNQKAARKRGH